MKCVQCRKDIFYAQTAFPVVKEGVRFLDHFPNRQTSCQPWVVAVIRTWLDVLDMAGRDTPLCTAESPIFPTFIAALQIVVKMSQRCEKIVQIAGSMHKDTLLSNWGHHQSIVSGGNIIHKYKNTQVHKYTNTQFTIYKYRKYMIHKYTLHSNWGHHQSILCGGKLIGGLTHTNAMPCRVLSY